MNLLLPFAGALIIEKLIAFGISEATTTPLPYGF